MKYTKEQIQCLRDNYPTLNYPEIEKMFPDTPIKKIRSLANSYGIKQDPKYKLKKAQDKAIGLSGIMTNGQLATIIEYISSSNITVRFEDGTIVKNKNLVDFKKGKIGKSTENRIGKNSISNSGLSMTVIKYRNYRDIDVQFEDGTIVKHKSYGCFLKGEIAYPRSNHIGEENTSTSGHKMKIINYRSYRDIDIQFEDGTIIPHKSYHNFLNGTIGYPKDNRLGEKKIANNGMLMTIIDYRNSNDIDIQFEDGTIVAHRDYRSFSNGSISNPNFYKSKVGEEIYAPNGHTLKIVDFRNNKDIDVQFEDGTIVQHRDYYSFLKGNIAKPLEGRVGQTNIAQNGMKIRIIEYRNSHDVDIEFEDGAIVRHKNYTHFLDGYIAYPRPDHIGEEMYSKSGMKMTIIAYRNNTDIDIQFEDGTIVKHRYYQNFKDGCILYPIENRIGFEKIANNGLKMKIINYRSATDLDIEFEDGCIVTNKSFSDFKRGEIGHPTVSTHRSLPEKIICFFIGQYIPYIPNYKPLWLLNNTQVTANFRSEFDIFIPSHSVAIEYDGCRFHQNVTKDNNKNICVSNHADIIKLFIRVREHGCPILSSSNNLKIINIEPFSSSHKDSYTELSKCIYEILLLLNIANPQVSITKEVIDYCRSDKFYLHELDMLNNIQCI
ncbi:MAG: hypothetical protein K2I22_04755 [Lachnospiraceae bacterium]|nr:hypothetical protein [Lachnospiraceae bacterium]